MTGDLFLTSLVIFPFVLVVGYLIQNLLWGRDIGPFKTIVNILAFIGVFFHEISHFILCICTGIPVSHIRVRLRNEENGQINPHGAVAPRRPYQVNFLQAVLAGLGPVLVGAWIIYFALQIALSSLIDPVVRIIAGLIVLSVFLASTPSPQDFRMMITGFTHDPRHSFYQIVLSSLSIFLAWSTVNLLSWTFPIEFVYYFVIIGWYIFLKVSLFGIRWGINKIRSRVGKEKYRTRFRRFSRRRYKSSKFK
jgi:hypothetical protein